MSLTASEYEARSVVNKWLTGMSVTSALAIGTRDEDALKAAIAAAMDKANKYATEQIAKYDAWWEQIRSALAEDPIPGGPRSMLDDVLAAIRDSAELRRRKANPSSAETHVRCWKQIQDVMEEVGTVPPVDSMVNMVCWVIREHARLRDERPLPKTGPTLEERAAALGLTRSVGVVARWKDATGQVVACASVMEPGTWVARSASGITSRHPNEDEALEAAVASREAAK